LIMFRTCSEDVMSFVFVNVYFLQVIFDFFVQYILLDGGY
jgi:hypothetical protein